jgi:hypothetical protein
VRRPPLTFTQAPDGSLEVEPPPAPPPLAHLQGRELLPLFEQIGAVVGVALFGWQLLEGIERGRRRLSRRGA